MVNDINIRKVLEIEKTLVRKVWNDHQQSFSYYVSLNIKTENNEIIEITFWAEEMPNLIIVNE